MAGKPSLVIRVAANIEELRRNLAQGQNQIETTAASMRKMAASFSGDKVIKDANAITAAIGGIENVSKLTRAEQDRVNAVLTTALEKYRALGREVPDDMAKLEVATRRVEQSTIGLTERIQAMAPRLTEVGTIMTAAITVPIVGALGLATKAAIDFESSFAGVRKTVDATEPEFAALAQGLRDMAKEIPVSVNELNKVAESAGQLGIRKEDILQFTRVMADLGVTTNLTADEAATATAQIQNIFGAAGKDVDRFGATLVALGNAGASTEKDIINMGLRIAGAGNQVGLTQAQVLAFASALSSIGINAEAGGSAISRVFLKINDAVAGGGKTMEMFAAVAGVSASAYKTAWERDAAGATVMFINGLSRLKGEGVNVNAVLEDLVGKNIILKDTLMRASGAGQLLNEQLALGNQAWKDNAALTKEAEERYNTFASQLTVLKNELQDVAIEVGTALLPMLRDLIDVARPAIGLIADLAGWFADLPKPVQTTAIALAALFAAIGPGLIILGQLVTSITAINGLIGAAGGMTALAGGLKVALAALWPVVAVGATAFASWNVGRAIGEFTGLTDKVEYLALRVQGFSAAEADAAIALRKKIEAQRAAGTTGQEYTEVVISNTAAVQTSTAMTWKQFEALQAAEDKTAKFNAELKKFEEHQKVLPPLTGLLGNMERKVVELDTSTQALRTNLRFTSQTIAEEMAPAVEQVTTKMEAAKQAALSWSDAMALVAQGQGSMTATAPVMSMEEFQSRYWELFMNMVNLGMLPSEAQAELERTRRMIEAAQPRAMGGPVSAGAAYVVGERGPEYFVPERSGQIVPNGGGGTTVHVSVAVQTGHVIGPNKAQFGALISDAIMESLRAKGVKLAMGTA